MSSNDGSASPGQIASHDAKSESAKPPEKKRARCQEKNRKAQARFRERQKLKVWETEKKISDLEAAVKQLAEDKEALQQRAVLLESQTQAPAVHQSMPASQQQAMPPAPAAVHAPPPAAYQHTEHVSRPCCGPLPQQHSMQPPPVPPPLSGAIDVSNGQVAWVGDRYATGSNGFEVVLPPKDVTPMAWESYVCFYKDQIHQMAPLLSPAQADPNSQAAVSCAQLLRELSETNRAIFFRSPALRDKVHTQPLLSYSEQPAAQPDVSLWRQVTAALQMSPQQRQHARELWEYYWNRMQTIMAERRQLSLLMQALEALQALSKNIAEETLAQIEVGHGLFCKVLTPLQSCSAYVGLFPYFPDKLAILSCVLEMDKSEEAVRSLVNELTR